MEGQRYAPAAFLGIEILKSMYTGLSGLQGRSKRRRHRGKRKIVVVAVVVVIIIIINHIVSACPILAKQQHIKRYDNACVHQRFNICKEIGVKLDNEHWYDRVPKSI